MNRKVPRPEGMKAIRETRLKAGLSCPQAAELLGCHPQTIWYWERINAPADWPELVEKMIDHVRKRFAS